MILSNRCMGACKSRKTIDFWHEVVNIPWLPIPYVVIHDGEVCKREEEDDA